MYTFDKSWSCFERKEKLNKKDVIYTKEPNKHNATKERNKKH